MKINLVCEGGGIKGIAHIGAVCALEDSGFTFNSFAGTSAGAMISSLLATGYSGHELKDILFNLDFNLYIKKTLLSSIPIIGEKLSLFKSKGLFSTDAIYELLTKLFEKKHKKYFKDISTEDINFLRIIATDISQKQLLIFPEDLKKYDVDPLDYEIAKSVIMSISIPLFFIPKRLKTSTGSCYIVDGGLMSNFPIWLYDNRKTNNYSTFGLRLTSDKDYKTTYAEKCSLTTYLFDIVDAAMCKNESLYFNKSHSLSIINIPTFNIGVTDFLISLQDKERLFKSGYDSTINFLKFGTKTKFTVSPHNNW